VWARRGQLGGGYSLLKRVDYFPVLLVRLRGLELELLVEYPTSSEKDTVGAVLHSLARKRLPKDTGLLLKET
jgi:hypothetical protein